MTARYCRTCDGVQPETRENGRPKVRRFRTGYVAVHLECGHWAAVSSPQLTLNLETAAS